MDLLLKALRNLSIGLTYAGGLAIIFMVGVVVVDIVGRHVFGFALVGAYDYVSYTLVVSVYAGMSEAFRQKAHITVDMIDNFTNETVRNTIKATALVLTFAMLMLVTWLCLGRAYDSFRFGDVTADLRIPKIWHWAAILVGLTVTCITLLELFLRSLASLLGVRTGTSPAEGPNQ